MDADAAVSADADNFAATSATDVVTGRAWSDTIAVPRTSAEVRQPKMNALWLRAFVNAFDLMTLFLCACARQNNDSPLLLLQSYAKMAWIFKWRKSLLEGVIAELMAGILCAGDIDLAISKLPPSEADVMGL